MADTPAVVAGNFYEAFARRDWRAMGSLYAEDARFSDPVFPELDAGAVRRMWQMLLTRGQDLRVSFGITDASGPIVRVHWTAAYTFAATGRPVINEVDAQLEVVDGRILRHVDRFDLWRWSRQALGVPGLLLGWTPLLRGKVRRTAAQALAAWQAREPHAGAP